MAQVTYSKQYSDAIQAIKQAILQSRYTAARLINREMLALYYAVGAVSYTHLTLPTTVIV